MSAPKILIKRTLSFFYRKLEFAIFNAKLELAIIPRIKLISGADKSHYKSLKQYIKYAKHFCGKNDIVIYDLGLTKAQNKELTNLGINIKFFDFGKYPDYFKIEENAGQYAWKPTIINQELKNHKGCLCWMDAGNIITSSLKHLHLETLKKGFYSPASSGVIAEWTHPKTLEYFKASTQTLNKYNLTGGCVSIDKKNMEARSLISNWAKLAMVKDCIAPKGSNRNNHRQDQSLLSLLYHSSTLPKMHKSYLGFKTHQDID